MLLLLECIATAILSNYRVFLESWDFILRKLTCFEINWEFSDAEKIPGSLEDVINIHLEFGTKQQFLLNLWHISDGEVEKRSHYSMKSAGLGRWSFT